jgi:hypothetical protein
MGLSTTFFPIHRAGKSPRRDRRLLSLAETFEARVGVDVWSFLGLEPRDSSNVKMQ